MIFRPAAVGDSPAIMQHKRGEGYAGLVGRWPQEADEAEFGKADSAFLLADDGAGPLRFVMLPRLDKAFGNVLLRRIAVAEPSQGVGSALLRYAAAYVFAQPAANRLYLHPHSRNRSAIEAHARFGFKEEGIEPLSYRRADGQREGNVLMSLPGPEWEAFA